MVCLNDIRTEAKSRGLDWSNVRAAYEEIKQAEREKREQPNEVRASAWMMLTAHTPGSWPFWRHGFSSRWGARVERHDYTIIPGYDEIAQQIASWFPEYTDDDGTERLWDFLMSPYDKLPETAEMYRKALDLVERQTDNEEIPF